VVSVMWSSVLVITWAVAMGVSQTAVIRSAWVAAVKALNRGHAGAVKHSLTEP